MSHSVENPPPKSVATAGVKPTLQNLHQDAQLEILEAFESPRELLTYVSASPAAARVYWSCKRTVLISIISKILSHAAVQTGVRVHHLIQTHGGIGISPPELGRIGASITDDYRKLSTDVLTTLFRMCCFHEPLVKQCMNQRWLRDRLYAAPNLYEDYQLSDGPWYHICERLERPRKGGVPLRARVYSAFFSLELLLRIWTGWAGEGHHNSSSDGMTESWGILFEPGEVYHVDLADIYALPAPSDLRISDLPTQYQQDFGWVGVVQIWGEDDLMVELSLVSQFLLTIYSSLKESSATSVPAQTLQVYERLRKLLVCVHNPLPSTLSIATSRDPRISQRDDALNVIGELWDAWEEVIDAPTLRPYTWEVGHRAPSPDQQEPDQ